MVVSVVRACKRVGLTKIFDIKCYFPLYLNTLCSNISQIIIISFDISGHFELGSRYQHFSVYMFTDVC